MLELDELRCFLAAATRLNFGAAARAVALSPPAFSDTIRRLEASLGTRLFERTTRSVRLSAAGERLLPQARRCLEEAERCRAAVAASDVPLEYELTVGTRYELGLSFILPLFPELERRKPERKLHLYFGDTPELLQKLGRGEIDAMVTSARLSGSRLELLPLHEEEYVFVAAPKLLERRPLRSARGAAAHRLLDLHDDLPLFRYFRDARPSHEAWSFRAVQYLGTIAAVRARVLDAQGVAVLPLYFVSHDLGARRLTRLFTSTELASDWFRLVWRAGHPARERFLLLAEELAKSPLR